MEMRMGMHLIMGMNLRGLIEKLYLILNMIPDTCIVYSAFQNGIDRCMSNIHPNPRVYSLSLFSFPPRNKNQEKKNNRRTNATFNP